MKKQPLIGFVVTAILMALFAFVIAFMAGAITPKGYPESTEAKIVLSAISVFFAVVSLFFAYIFGKNKECGKNLATENDLLPNEIYGLVAGGFSGGKFFCYLRLRNNEVRAFRLDRKVPPVFKYVRNKEKPGEYFYQKYPLNRTPFIGQPVSLDLDCIRL